MPKQRFICFEIALEQVENLLWRTDENWFWTELKNFKVSIWRLDRYLDTISELNLIGLVPTLSYNKTQRWFDAEAGDDIVSVTSNHRQVQ